jgi:hypothetical protein
MIINRSAPGACHVRALKPAAHHLRLHIPHALWNGMELSAHCGMAVAQSNRLSLDNILLLVQVQLLTELEQQKAELLQQLQIASSSLDAQTQTAADDADEDEDAVQAGPSGKGGSSCYRGGSSGRRGVKGAAAGAGAAGGQRPRGTRQRQTAVVGLEAAPGDSSSNLLRGALVLSGGAAGAVVAAAAFAVAHGRSRS